MNERYFGGPYGAKKFFVPRGFLTLSDVMQILFRTWFPNGGIGADNYEKNRQKTWERLRHDLAGGILPAYVKTWRAEYVLIPPKEWERDDHKGVRGTGLIIVEAGDWKEAPVLFKEADAAAYARGEEVDFTAISPALGRDVSWTLDQALLWIATRDENIVAAGSRTLTLKDRCSWMRYRVSSPSEFKLFPDDAEAAMLRVLQEGRVTARRDLEVVPAVWFHEAKYAYGVECTHFQRQDEHPFERVETTEGNALMRYAVERLDPALGALELRDAFPVNEIRSAEPHQSDKQGRDASGQDNSSGGRTQAQRLKAQKALAEMYPDGIPEVSDLSNKELYRQVAEKLGIKVPSQDTVLRAAGRK